MFFSIIIPTYNRASLILNTLNSIKNQNYQDYEVIIIDDGSSDDTKIVVEEYIKENSLLNWYYFFKLNGERGAARNYGVTKAKGEWITFLDSDDLFYPNHLTIASAFISTISEIYIFHSAHEYINDRGDVIRTVKYPKNGDLNTAILKGNILSCFGMFIKYDMFNKFRFDENRVLSGSEDWLLWLRISAQYKIYLQPKISGCMVQHNERSVLSFKENELVNRTNLLKTKLLEDAVFKKRFSSNQIKCIFGHMLTYTALHLVLSNKKREGVIYFIKGLLNNPSELFTRRTAVFLYKLIT